jgi:hypothetical protein
VWGLTSENGGGVTTCESQGQPHEERRERDGDDDRDEARTDCIRSALRGRLRRLGLLNKTHNGRKR